MPEFKMGRNRPVAVGPKFSLKNYLMKSLPSPPPSCNYGKQAGLALSQMYMNDTLGDCVIAGMGHLGGIFTANAGGPELILTKPQVISLYSAIGGYVPGDESTDNGCDEVTALNYWRAHGAPIGSHKISNWMAVDATNVSEFQTAIWLFENILFGLELPDAWVNPFPGKNGFLWTLDGTPDPNNGHCIVGMAYSDKDKTVGISTWGMYGEIANNAVQYYCAPEQNGALYTVLSPDIISRAKAKAPNGVDWTQLSADFDSMG